MDYSLRIYKNEYAELHLNFICKAFKVNLETEKVIEIVGEQEQLEKVMSGMFCTDEQFKALFPEYQTRKEREEWTSKELETLKKQSQQPFAGLSIRVSHPANNSPSFAIST